MKHFLRFLYQEWVQNINLAEATFKQFWKPTKHMASTQSMFNTHYVDLLYKNE